MRNDNPNSPPHPLDTIGVGGGQEIEKTATTKTENIEEDVDFQLKPIFSFFREKL